MAAADSLFTMLMTKKPGNFAEQVGAPSALARRLSVPVLASASEGRREEASGSRDVARPGAESAV